MATRPLQTITLKNEGGDDITYTLSGTYPDLTAGAAEQIISDDYTENKVPYLLRASNFGSKREDDTLVGGTVAFNQTAPKGGGSANVSTKQYDAETGITTITPANYNGDNVGLYSLNNAERIVGHKYYVSADVYADYAVQIKMGFNATAIKQNISATTWTRIDGVQSYASASLTVYAAINSAGWASGTFKIRNVMCFDLTQMFGSTIADYIYSLEQATAGAGVAWFKALFPADYYAYNAGELMSVSGVSAHSMVGKNRLKTEAMVAGILNASGVVDVQGVTIGAKTKASITWTSSSTWRGVTSDFIPVTAGGHYYLSLTETVSYVLYAWYDANKTFISRTSYNGSSMQSVTAPNNAAFVRYTLQESTAGTFTYHNIQLEHGSSATTYEPYKTWSYPLDSSLTLRGIPKLDANNSLYYDGDIYESDGTVKRKYGIVDLGTLNWTASSVTYGGADYSVYRSDINQIPMKVHALGVCSKLLVTNQQAYAADLRFLSENDNSVWIGSSYWNSTSLRVVCRYDSVSTAADFKTAMNGVYMVYELATPTTETADPFTNPQNVDPNGTEEYVTTSIVPVGHETKYFADLVGRLEAIPDPPTANGTYRLIATVTGGVATLSWVAN